MGFILAQVLGIFGTISNVISMQLKNKEQILICFVLAGVFYSISYVLLGGYTGAIICIVATLQTFISYLLEKRKKEIPKWLIAVFFVLSMIGGIMTYQSIVDIFSILAGISYTWSIVQKKEKYIRWITLSNSTLWFIYDMFVKAYSTCISDVIFIISTVIGIIRFDVIKK